MFLIKPVVSFIGYISGSRQYIQTVLNERLKFNLFINFQ